MRADWKWNGMGTKVGYRKQMAVYEIKDIKRRLFKNNNKNNVRINTDDEYTESNRMYFELNNHHEETILDAARILNNSQFITETQRDCLIEYYLHHKTMEEIGREKHMSKQGVCCNIKNGIKNIKAEYNGEEI
jgi:DNA-directed RNA polymerase specialized sigma subunit